MLPLILSALIHSAALPAEVPMRAPAHPGLAARAPGSPDYGLVVTTSVGKFLVTNLAFDPVTREPKAHIYRILGPAGMGPYWVGVELTAETSRAFADLDKDLPTRFFIIKQIPEDSPARKLFYKGSEVFAIDGQTFGWDPRAAEYYLSHRPEAAWSKVDHTLFLGYSIKKVRVVARRAPAAEPDLATLEVAEPGRALEPAWGDLAAWKALLAARCQSPRSRPCEVQLDSQQFWLVRGQAESKSGVSPSPVVEFWSANPAGGAWTEALVETTPEPKDGLRLHRVLRAQGRWWRISDLRQDSAGRLEALAVRPLQPDIPALLKGALIGKDLGPTESIPLREELEGWANKALLEWKVRQLPGVLATNAQPEAEALVMSLEEGLLALDLESKGIRARLDAATRAETERKAQAELAARDSRPVPTAPVGVAESERLADLLDQRKAILMAILASAKQALAVLRR